MVSLKRHKHTVRRMVILSSARASLVRSKPGQLTAHVTLPTRFRQDGTPRNGSLAPNAQGAAADGTETAKAKAKLFRCLDVRKVREGTKEARREEAREIQHLEHS